MAAEALRRGYVFPYLIDQTYGVAQAYGADRTPDFYLFGAERRLAYHGRFGELRQAVERALAGGPPAEHQAASHGRPIRWREGG